MIFPDDRRVCFRHATEQDRALINDLDGLAPEIGLKPLPADMRGWGSSFGWPYGPNIDVQARIDMLKWAREDGLRLSTGDCLHWLCTGRCGKRYDIRGCREGWMDHVTGWNRGKGRNPAVLVSQPYGISAEGKSALHVLGEEPGIRVEVKDSGWYGYGTNFIGVWKWSAS